MIKTNKGCLSPKYEVRFERGIYIAEFGVHLPKRGYTLMQFLMEKRLEYEDEEYVRGVIKGIVERCSC